MKEQTMITLKLSKELLARLKEISSEEETTVSALIRRLCISYIEKIDDKKE